MKSISLSSVLATSALLFIAGLPSVSAQQETEVGCFSSSEPLKSQGSYTYQSNGYCLDLCYKAGYSVFGLYSGNVCLCGNKIPQKSTKVEDSQCNDPCAAWPVVMCGGDNAFSVYLTGLTSSVEYYSPSSSTSTANGTSTTTTDSDNTSSQSSSTSTGSGAGQTVFETVSSQTTQASAQAEEKSGPNTAAIAAGVVVGVVGLCAMIGAGFFLWRFKTRHPADQRFRDVNNAESFGKPMSQDSMSDSRFDGDFMAQRRQSNGSIDDDRDFSRRILQVTNPDRR
ncbi:hypothetical protein P175DRAFT_0535113 [Aspergillus ochraceoroseus IBT 24754]|uniref:WSC domain-containing protein n=3 Tax=Aspergillus subgen. Nidulantes TaxID=2720870 RepID=A0A0F8U7Q6_9EURO|nr:uncharacterized protein P175DRAFT_0535113 [Aspergillus ochraceoroseus IBT 24754]KKK13761.1 hypothetical protein AOCH_007560 [Aspergillus ochraceoroseus]KKK15623.1 hypothetical protein ARAM_006222 [Aspergillus rambellii]PTU18202.1 hypothetical protein P175DRAFT_0535113 [Aspergillus ochraceoroseus IBT 24754]